MLIAVFLLMELAFAVGLLAYLFVKKPKARKFLPVAQASKMVFAAFLFVSMREASIKAFPIWVFWTAIGIAVTVILVCSFSTPTSSRKTLINSQGQNDDLPPADPFFHQ